MDTLKKCKDGYKVGDPMVIPKTRYNKKGYMLLSMGFSAKPVEVVFQCQQCGEILDTSTNEDVIEKYRYNSDIIQ
jgi:hypothetical protein